MKKFFLAVLLALLPALALAQWGGAYSSTPRFDASGTGLIPVLNGVIKGNGTSYSAITLGSGVETALSVAVLANGGFLKEGSAIGATTPAAITSTTLTSSGLIRSNTHVQADLNLYGVAANSALILGAGADANVSRLGSASLAIGNGTAGNTSGALTLTTLTTTNTAGGTITGATVTTTGLIRANTHIQADLNYYAVAANSGIYMGAASDASISRLGAASFAVGNSSAGNTSGTLTLTNINLSGTGIVLSGLGAATGTPSSLCLNGTTVTVNAALTCTVSARDQKNTIKPFDGNGLALVAAMQPDTFFYNDNGKRNRIGLVADDLAKIDPRLSEWDADGRPSSIDFSAIMSVLVKSVQEQQAQINALKASR